MYHTVQDSHAYKSADCGNKSGHFFRLRDCKKKVPCGHTKAASIDTDVLASSSVENCLRELKTPMVQV